MSSFSLRYPFFVLMLCLVIVVVGVTAVVRMPVDLFPEVKIPVVVVATFYAGMPPQQIESNITNSYERFFTLGSGIDHIESRSMTGVSLIKIYFQAGVNPDSAVSNISNLAMANLRRLPPGTLPPVVLKFDAVQSARLPDHAEGPRPESNTTERSCPVQRSQPGCQRTGCFGAAALWRPLSADHGLRRSAETGSARHERDGRGPLDQRIEPDPSCRRRSRWHQRLQHLRK